LLRPTSKIGGEWAEVIARQNGQFASWQAVDCRGSPDFAEQGDFAKTVAFAKFPQFAAVLERIEPLAKLATTR